MADKDKNRFFLPFAGRLAGGKNFLEWVRAINGDYPIPEGTGDPFRRDKSNAAYFRIQNVGFAAADNITEKVFLRQPMTFPAHNPIAALRPGCRRPNWKPCRNGSISIRWITWSRRNRRVFSRNTRPAF